MKKKLKLVKSVTKVIYHMSKIPRKKNVVQRNYD